MNLSIKFIHPIFVHRVWECAGTDLLGVFDSEYFADLFAHTLVESGREPERTCIVSCNSYTGEMRRFNAKPKKAAGS